MSDEEVDDKGGFSGSEQNDYESENDSDASEESATNKKRKKLKGRQTLKKKKKVKKDNPLAKFYEVQASEDSDEEDDDYDDDVSDTEKKKAKAMEHRLQPASMSQRKGLDFLKLEDEDLENALKNKEAQYIEEDMDLENDELANAGLLPTYKDPHVFAVKVKPGCEREAVLLLMNKYFESLGTNEEFLIFSASSVDKTQGYIYIEAYTNAHVFRAIKDIGIVDQKYCKIIHLNDRIQVFEPDLTKKYELQPFQYVRMKRGLYEGDLAQIVEVQEHKSRAQVRLIPRLTADEDKNDDEEEKGNGISRAQKGIKKFQENARKNIRPPQRLFVPSEHPDCEAKRDFDGRPNTYVFKNQSFANGLLYKRVNFKSLQVEKVNPTIEEIQIFVQALGEKDEKIYDPLLDMNKKNYRFLKGDKVKVIKGDLVNLEGVVIKVTDQQVTIIPKMEDLKDPIDFQPTDLVKNFSLGDCVKVVSGKNSGKVGFIIKVDDNIARIKTDDLRNDIEAFLNDLILASGRALTDDSGVKNQMENYKKFDLVLLNDQKTFGVIFGLDETSARIVDNHGYTQTINQYQILYKINTRNNVNRNDLKQIFSGGCSVKVLEGFNKGKVGTVKHIYQDYLFLYSVDFISTAGVFVEKANNCYLLSAMQRQNNQSPMQTNQNQGANQNQNAQKNLVGQKCAVVSGVWKGYQGIIKEVNERTYRVELTAKCCIKDFKRDEVRTLAEINAGPTFTEPVYNDPKTPMHGRFNPQSPGYGMHSPGFEASPAWGADMGSPSYESHLK